MAGALATEQGRTGARRTRARIALLRGSARRRILPPVAVGSGALVGSAVLATWLSGPSLPAADAGPAKTAPSADERQLEADADALNRLRQSLAADQAVVAALAQQHPAAGAPSPAAGGSAGVTRAGASPTPSLPALAPVSIPPAAAAPVAAPPPTHTTTGASVVAP